MRHRENKDKENKTGTLIYENMMTKVNATRLIVDRKMQNICKCQSHARCQVKEANKADKGKS